MTEIDFYILKSNQTRLDFAAKLCHKVYTLGHRIFICTEDQVQSFQLSDNLWNLNPESFLAHEVIDIENSAHRTTDENSERTAKSPIKISHNICEDSAPILDNDVLINLSLDIPPHFSRFKRSVEIIAGEESIKEKLRKNYSFYKQRGYPLKMHDLNKK